MEATVPDRGEAIVPRKRNKEAERRRCQRYRDRHPERRRESCRKATAKYDRSEKGIRQRQRREAVAKERGGYSELVEMRVTHGRHLDNPSLTWMDAHGRIHRELELSAEELIRRYNQRKDGHQ